MCRRAGVGGGRQRLAARDQQRQVQRHKWLSVLALKDREIYLYRCNTAVVRQEYHQIR
jgi:hypothetical protein